MPSPTQFPGFWKIDSSRPPQFQVVKKVTFVCKVCGRVLELFERRSDNWAETSKNGFPPEGLALWTARNRFGHERYPGPVPAQELGRSDIVSMQAAGVWQYRCHKDCDRPWPALVPELSHAKGWLDQKLDGARVEV